MLWRTASLSTAGAVFLASAALADRAPAVDSSHPMTIVYPVTAQRAGEEGTVVLRVYVNVMGQPATVKIVQSSGYPDLDNAAVESALNARYVPAIEDGATSADWATVQIVYRLPTVVPGAQ
jgi:TonB family protein